MLKSDYVYFASTILFILELMAYMKGVFAKIFVYLNLQFHGSVLILLKLIEWSLQALSVR